MVVVVCVYVCVCVCGGVAVVLGGGCCQLQVHFESRIWQGGP